MLFAVYFKVIVSLTFNFLHGWALCMKHIEMLHHCNPFYRVIMTFKFYNNDIKIVFLIRALWHAIY
jgi:hypothetical protein